MPELLIEGGRFSGLPFFDRPHLVCLTKMEVILLLRPRVRVSNASRRREPLWSCACSRRNRRLRLFLPDKGLG